MSTIPQNTENVKRQKVSNITTFFSSSSSSSLLSSSSSSSSLLSSPSSSSSSSSCSSSSLYLSDTNPILVYQFVSTIGKDAFNTQDEVRRITAHIDSKGDNKKAFAVAVVRDIYMQLKNNLSKDTEFDTVERYMLYAKAHLCVCVPILLEALLESEYFLPSTVDPNAIQRDTFLGILFNSTIFSEKNKISFDQYLRKNCKDSKERQAEMNKMVELNQTNLYTILHELLKPPAFTKTRKWIKSTIIALIRDSKKCDSSKRDPHSFLFTLSVILVRYCLSKKHHKGSTLTYSNFCEFYDKKKKRDEIGDATMFVYTLSLFRVVVINALRLAAKKEDGDIVCDVFEKKIFYEFSFFCQIICEFFTNLLEDRRDFVIKFVEPMARSVVKFYSLSIDRAFNQIHSPHLVNTFILVSRLFNATDLLPSFRMRFELLAVIEKAYTKGFDGSMLKYTQFPHTTINDLLELYIQSLEAPDRKPETSNSLVSGMCFFLGSKSCCDLTPEIMQEREVLALKLLPNLLTNIQKDIPEALAAYRSAKDKFTTRITQEVTSHINVFFKTTYHISSQMKFLEWLLQLNEYYFEPYLENIVRVLNSTINDFFPVLNDHFLKTSLSAGVNCIRVILLNAMQIILNLIRSKRRERYVLYLIDTRFGFDHKKMIEFTSFLSATPMFVPKSIPYCAAMRLVSDICDVVRVEQSTILVSDPDLADPITEELMVDPVLLPTSGRVVDLQTIKQHLAKQQTDPFSRTPLTEDELVACPNTTAKLRAFWDHIENYIKQAISPNY